MKIFNFFLVPLFLISSININAQSINIGDKAPELAYNNPKEEILKLSKHIKHITIYKTGNKMQK